VKSQLQPGHLEAHRLFKILAIKHKPTLDEPFLMASAGEAGCEAAAAGGCLVVCVACCGCSLKDGSTDMAYCGGFKA